MAGDWSCTVTGLVINIWQYTAVGMIGIKQKYSACWHNYTTEWMSRAISLYPTLSCFGLNLPSSVTIGTTNISPLLTALLNYQGHFLPQSTYSQFLLSLNCNCTWVCEASLSSLHLPLVKPSFGHASFTFVRAFWASHYQGHSTTDFQRMSASFRSYAPLHVAFHNCKISPHAAVRSAGLRAINWWKGKKILSQFT